MSEFTDPYVYPGTSVLRNKLNLLDAGALSIAEHRYVSIRQNTLEKTPVGGSFDMHHLRAVHRVLFQDIYEWAGELRTVNISKNGDRFHHAAQMQNAAEYTFGWLAESGLISDKELTDAEFVAASAEFLARVNYMHPFREGNGRTQRAFLNDVASVNGRAFRWDDLDAQENADASMTSHATGDGHAFIGMLGRIVRPREEEVLHPRRPASPSAPPGGRRSLAGRCGALTAHGGSCRRRGRCPYHR